MKVRCFLISVFTCLILLSCKTNETEKNAILEAYKKSGAEAASIYEETRLVIEMTPRILYNLAYSYVEDKNWSAAIAVALEGEEKFPEYLRFNLLEAYVYRVNGLIESYHNKLRDILSKDPANDSIREMLLRSLVDYNRLKEAEEEAKEMLERSPTNALALQIMARVSPFYAELSAGEYKTKSIDGFKPAPALKSFEEVFLEILKPEEREEETNEPQEAEKRRLPSYRETRYNGE